MNRVERWYSIFNNKIGVSSRMSKQLTPVQQAALEKMYAKTADAISDSKRGKYSVSLKGEVSPTINQKGVMKFLAEKLRKGGRSHRKRKTLRKALRKTHRNRKQ